MAAHIHRHGQAGHVGGGAVSMDRPKQVVRPPKPWGPMPRALISSSSSSLQLGIEGVGVGLVDGAEQGMLGQTGRLVKGAADADAQHDGGQGLEPARRTVSTTNFSRPPPRQRA